MSEVPPPFECFHEGCDWKYWTLDWSDLSAQIAAKKYDEHIWSVHDGIAGHPTLDADVNAALDEMIDRYTPQTTGVQRDRQREVLRHVTRILRERKEPGNA